MKNAWIKKVLNQEMKLATGCTEPGAIMELCIQFQQTKSRGGHKDLKQSVKWLF